MREKDYEISAYSDRGCEINFLCSVDGASRYNRLKKTQLDAQLILSMFRQPLHVSGLPQ